MKSTSIFGGVQLFQIVISIIRSKFIAVLLGPMGMGVSGLLTSTIGLVQMLTSFGLGTSAVRDVSAAFASGNATRLFIVVTVFRRIMWVTGLLGAIITLISSPWLSELTFGNRDYSSAFMLISMTLLLNQISVGQGVLLRGTRQINSIARSGIIGSFLGLFTTIPLYYFWGIKGIVPGIIISAVTSLVVSWYYSREIEILPIYVSKARTIAEGRDMIKIGFFIGLNGLIVTVSSYVVRVFINSAGNIDDVGLYNAGFAIVTTYVGLVFTAMSTDYYPVLSAAAHSNKLCRNLINQQAEVALLIITPIILVFLVFINWIVILLYSSKFAPINDMILYAAMGMLFKSVSWSIAFVFLAKGDSKLFFWSELISSTYVLVLNILGYKLYGLTGMGISFMVGYIIYLVQVFIVSKVKYGFHFERSFSEVFYPQLVIATICLVVVKFTSNPYSYVLGILLIIISLWISYKGLDKRIGFRSLVNKYIKAKYN
ncbi:MAG: O-antigen translocase [Syntrophomonas sp.]